MFLGFCECPTARLAFRNQVDGFAGPGSLRGFIVTSSIASNGSAPVRLALMHTARQRQGSDVKVLADVTLTAFDWSQLHHLSCRSCGRGYCTSGTADHHQTALLLFHFQRNTSGKLHDRPQRSGTRHILGLIIIETVFPGISKNVGLFILCVQTNSHGQGKTILLKTAFGPFSVIYARKEG